MSGLRQRERSARSSDSRSPHGRRLGRRPYHERHGDIAARRRASAPPAVDEGPCAEHGREVLGRSEAAPRREPRDRLRGGPLSQYRRVLGPWHRDVPDPRRHVHACVPVLLRQLGQARRAAGPPRAVPARAGGLDDGPLAHRRDLRRPRRPARQGSGALRGVEEKALATVVGARPEVFNHNIETVRRLHRRMRGAKASYDGALTLLRRAKEIADYPVLTKSGIIVGLGETNDEVVDTMRDLRANGVDVVTIGQYLQPSSQHAKIDRWVHPDEFRWMREQGEALGFGSVFAGPLVRSSYRADEQRHAAETGQGAVAYSRIPVSMSKFWCRHTV